MNDRPHFTEEEIALCAEAVNEGRYAHLPETLRGHLSECDQCASEVLMVADIAFDFKENERQLSPWRKSWVLYATLCSSAAAILLFFIFTLSRPDSNPALDKTMIAQSDSSAKNGADQDSVVPKSATEPGNQLMASMHPNEKLEKLYQNHQQTYRAMGVEVITKGVVEYPASDSLKWKNESKEMLQVEIFDNREHKVQSLQTHASAVKIPVMATGIYYWKLISEDFDLLYVGKIIVK